MRSYSPSDNSGTFWYRAQYANQHGSSARGNDPGSYPHSGSRLSIARSGNIHWYRNRVRSYIGLPFLSVPISRHFSFGGSGVAHLNFNSAPGAKNPVLKSMGKFSGSRY